MKDRIALVTGASRGIGRVVALGYAGAGATVIAVARSQGALESLDDEIKGLGGHCILVAEDLTNFAKIDEMGLAVRDRFGRLDVLVGNAALLGTLGPLSHTTPGEWDRVMAVNVTANQRLIRTFEPLLRQSEAGRAVFVTSGIGTTPYWGAYATSKAALECMVKVWAGELAKTEIRANLIDPGAVRTALRAQAFPGEDPKTLPLPESLTKVFIDLASPRCKRNGDVVRAY